MHAWSGILTTIVGVLLAAGLAALGWWFRTHRGEIAELRAHFDSRIDTLEQAVQVLTQANTVVVRDFQTLGEHLDGVQVRAQTLSESTAVLAATVEQHQRWIEERNRDAYQRAARAKH